MPGRKMLAMLLLGFFPGLTGAARPAPLPTADVSIQITGASASGDDLFAAGLFAEAAAAYEQAVANDPNSATSVAALARMRLYQHREDEAAELARKAMVLSPGNALAAQVLKTVDSRRAAFAPDVYRLDPGAAAAVDFLVTDPLPVVPVRIDGRSANFLIDTGAPDIVINPALAKTLGLATTDAGVGVFAGGLHAQVQRTTAPELKIGDIQFKNLPAAINPAELPGLQTDGVIGTGLLMHVLATIDYCRGRLVLAPRSTSAAFEQRAAKSGANIVPMWLVGDHFIFARGEINRVEGLYSIDTGLAGGGLVATKSTVEAAGIVLDVKKASVGQGGGGKVRFVPFRADAKLGALTRSDVPGVYMSDGDPYGMFRFKVAGALSHSFFRQSRVTLDFDAMKLVTESCE
jgi:predicted aspartyl protease